MKILVIGGGAREHALGWKLRQSSRVEHLWCIPGNAGIAELAECIDGSAADVQQMAETASNLKPDLTIVGPEQPLVLGIADEFQSVGSGFSARRAPPRNSKAAKCLLKNSWRGTRFQPRVPTASSTTRWTRTRPSAKWIGP